MRLGLGNLELIVFGLLMLLLLLSASDRQHLRHKSRFAWGLDLSNLTIQGILIPFLRVGLIMLGLKLIWPAAQGSLQISFLSGFLLNFVGVDYLYYWNHRLFHHKRLFPLHLVHHTVDQMDVLATSRNTLWTSFLIVYLWVNGLLLYLTDLNSGYLLAMSLTACLDLWKHSNHLRHRPQLQRKISRYLGIMTPLDHAWHHSSQLNSNYGANFNLFDRLHGSYCAKSEYPAKLGVKTRLSPWQQLLFPF